MSAFKEQLLAIAAGKTDNEFETSKQTLAGEKINIWARWHVVPGYEQSLSRIFIATIDITERKETHHELQASRERLRALSAHLQYLREQERVAIARDLHDELGQALTSLKMDMSMLERKAKSVSGKFDGALWIEIADNGKGISAEALNATSKFGLLGMRERAIVFGGEVTITGTAGRGTTVTIKVPISDEKRI